MTGIDGDEDRIFSYGQVEVSPDGRLALAELPEIAENFSFRLTPDTSHFRVIDLETGEITLIDRERFVRSSGWLPNSGLFFVSAMQDVAFDSPSNVGAPYFVFATDAPNGIARLLFTPDQVVIDEPIRLLVAPTSRGNKPLVWSAQNSTMLTTVGELTFLFQFEIR